MGSMLYEKRFGPYFIEPVIAGLSEENKPFISTMDLLGSTMRTEDFVVGGTCTEQLFGVCESMYRPNLGPEDLFETLSQCLLAGVDRDCVTGWGGQVYIMTGDQII